MGSPSRVAQERWPWRDDPAGHAVCYAITVEVLVKPITNIDDPRYVKAMSHPLRVRILALLDERPASPVELSGWRAAPPRATPHPARPGELSGWLGSTLGTTAYHVRTLERLGLVELVAEHRVRGAVEHHYRAR